MQIESEIRAIARGDRAAFAALYSRMQACLLGYATGLLAGDRSAAEDVIDEAFMDIWQKASQYHALGSAEGWVRRIVRNKAIDWLRKSRERVGLSEPVMARYAAMPDQAPTPEEQACLQSDADFVQTALSQLSLEHREAIWLCYFEEKSLREIAIIAGCPENTVKTRLFHARRQMKALSCSA